MHFVTHFTIAIISLLMIVFSCVLFTNAIEIVGNKLKFGNNATGSILAVIGTGLPEFIIPLVAILGAKISNVKIDIAQDIALGAILGSPFMLSTLALFLLAIVLIIKKRNSLNIEYSMILRDYKYFLLAYFIAILFGFNFLNNYKIFGCVFLFVLYVFFVFRTIIKSKAMNDCECEKLYLKLKNEKTALFIQLIFSLFLLVLSSHFFVEEIKYFSSILNVSASILALIVTPFATELPECINSIIWLRQNKDDLAIANILGAVVFQVTLLFSMGMFLTNWSFSTDLFINSILTIFGAVLFTLCLIKTKKIALFNLLICGIIYFIYFILIFLK